jgi:hypothetical protein
MRPRNRLQSPRCPFCGASIDPPEKEGIGEFSQFEGGRCACGALFGSDPRGSSLGALMIDLLAHACGDDRQRAVELQEGIDFDEAWIYGYNERLHHVVSGTPGPRRGVGTLYFVRLRPV